MDERRARGRVGAGRVGAGRWQRWRAHRSTTALRRGLLISDQGAADNGRRAAPHRCSRWCERWRRFGPTRLLVKLAECRLCRRRRPDLGHRDDRCGRGDCRAASDVLLVGQDRIPELIVEAGTLDVGEQVLARVDHLTRHKTEATTPPATCSRLAARARGQPCAPGRLLRGPGQAALRLQPRARVEREELRDVEDRVNAWIARNDPSARSQPRSTRPGGSVRWHCSARSTARRCGWSRSAKGILARAVRRHARALDRRDRRVSHSPRDLELRQR